MNYYFKNEFKIVLFSRRSIYVFIITLGLLLISFFNFINIEGFNLNEFKVIYDSLDVYIYIRKDLLVLIAPILASLVFSDSYLLDSESGFLNYIYIRTNKIKYITIKLLVNALVSGIVITFASSIIILFLIILLGVNNNHLHDITGPFNFIYYQSRILYFLLLLGVSFIFNVVFSTLSLGLSPWIKNRYLTTLSSFFYYFLSGTLLVSIGLTNLNANILYTLNPIAAESNIILYQIILFIIGVILFFTGVLFKDEKNN